MTQRHRFDGVLVIGAGLAGLSAALSAAPRPTLVLATAPIGQGCSSGWAQGGMAAALGDDDAPALHAADTLAAGAGLCDPRAVDILTREGPAAIHWLAALGAPFDRRHDGSFVQSLEAAHSRARVSRVGGDGAGAAIMGAMAAAARRASHLEVREGWRVRAVLTDDLGRACGVVAENNGELVEILASATILATGGLGGLYRVTTNPAAARGEGLALAAQAGARIVDPEFVQFHPTAIDIGADPAPLATEALRGEGARLVGADGAPFMHRYHTAGDLAPRDIVARAITNERREGRGAFLDATAAVGRAFPRHFPTVFAACMAAGVDPRERPIPVLPAAHYHMGGIGTDLAGRTSVEALFAVGECASTGVHGANRLASNSLLEAAVFGARAGAGAKEIGATPDRGRSFADAFIDDPPAATLAELRNRMSRDAGVVRDAQGLGGLLQWLDTQIADFGPAAPFLAARLVARGAFDRHESRGAHCRADFPDPATRAVHTEIVTDRRHAERTDFSVAAA